ncbi:MAG: hypothetical protein WCG26_04310 [Chloroflexales bacterium]
MPLPEAITRFLDDLRRAERSPHTVRAYRTEQSHLCACYDGPVGTVALDTVRAAVAHKHIQTTLRYAGQSDTVADAELRQRRRTIQRTR